MGTAARVAVATGGSAVGSYSKIVFTGWDYGCLGDKATKLKQKNFHYRLQVRGDLSYLGKKWKSDMWCVAGFLAQVHLSSILSRKKTCGELTPSPSLSLSGGSGGGEDKEIGSLSHLEAENNSVLPACSPESGQPGAHCGCLLWHLRGHCLQPGEWGRRQKYWCVLSEILVYIWLNLSLLVPLSLPNRAGAGRKGSWVWFFSTYLPSSSPPGTSWCLSCVTRSPCWSDMPPAPLS